MIPVALFKKFLSKQLISSVEVSNIARCSSRTKNLVAAELPLIWVKPFICFKNYILFNYIYPENDYKNSK